MIVCEAMRPLIIPRRGILVASLRIHLVLPHLNELGNLLWVKGHFVDVRIMRVCLDARLRCEPKEM